MTTTALVDEPMVTCAECGAEDVEYLPHVSGCPDDMTATPEDRERFDRETAKGAR